MPNYTDNHELQLFSDSEEPWEHRSDFEHLDTAVEIRDIDSERSNYDPKDGALFLATDTGEVYLGDGSSWSQIGSVQGGGDALSVQGIDNTHDHVGPMHQGGYHEDGDEMWGVAFAANADMPVESTVVDFNATDSTTGEVDISLYESQTTNAGDANQPQPVVPDGMTESEALVGSVTTTLDDGPHRIQLGFTTPSDPATGEFFLGAEPATAGEVVYMRRILDWGQYDTYTFDHIDLLYSGRWNNPTNGDYSTNYYRMFDIEVGDPEKRVTSPWSTDVDEIYMRPRNPEEEFDSVSPKALWIDTS